MIYKFKKVSILIFLKFVQEEEEDDGDKVEEGDNKVSIPNLKKVF